MLILSNHKINGGEYMISVGIETVHMVIYLMCFRINKQSKHKLTEKYKFVWGFQTNMCNFDYTII